MKKLVSFLLCLILCVCALPFTACGGGSEEVIVGVSNATSEVNIANALVNAYKSKNPNAQITVQRISGDYGSYVINNALSGNLPDVLFTQDDTVAYFSQEGVFEPLDSYMQSAGIDTNIYYDAIMDISRPLDDGKTYFIPRDYNKVVCYLNVDMFSAADIELPTDDWTWEDFISICAEFRSKMDANLNQDAGIHEYAYPVYANVGWKAVYWPIIASYGESIFNAQNGFAITSESRAIAQLKTLVDNGYTTNPNTDGSGLFRTGQAAMSFAVRPDLSNFVTGGRNIEFVSFPAVNGVDNAKVGMGCSGYGISSFSKNKDKAWDFLKFVMSEDGQKAFGETGNGVPMIESMSTDTCWKNITVSSVDLSAKNHEAFIKNANRDIVTNYMGSIPASKHKLVYEEMDKFIKAVFSDQYKNDLSACISTYTNLLKNIIG